MRKTISLIAALGAISFTSSAFAETSDAVAFNCHRDNLVRKVNVVVQPKEAVACEVRYQKVSEGGRSDVLWHARNDVSFCDRQATALAGRLGQAGWTCLRQGQTAEADINMPIAEPMAVAMPVGKEPSGVTAATKPVRRTLIDPNDPALLPRPVLSTDDRQMLLRPSVK